MVGRVAGGIRNRFTGGTYFGTGIAGAAFSFIILMDPEAQPGDKWGYFAAVAGLIALGLYDLEQAKGDPTSAEIFRDNMIGINLVIGTTLATRWLFRRR